MGRLDFSDAANVDVKVLEFLDQQPDASLKKPTFRLQKTSNRHALCQYLDPAKKSIVNKWVLVRRKPDSPPDSNDFHQEVEDLSLMHALFLGADIAEDTPGSLTLRIRGPLNFPSVLKIAQDEEGQPMVLVEHEGSLVIVDWLHVNLDVPSSVLVQAVGISAEDGSPRTIQHTVDLSGLPLELA